MQSKYDPSQIEAKWYEFWMENNLFRSVPDEREPYTIVIPPPNVTGVLHMGHMLNNTIQDVLIRRARMLGYNACWVPGTDHASIATEAKVVKMLAEQGIKKSEIGREKFLEHAFEWKDKYGGIILNQLRKLGVSCDWERTRFTMEESLSKAVQHTFVDLYKKGKIYRDHRISHWDPVAKTALSDQEVYHKDSKSNLYHIKYMIVGTEGEYVTVATTRPETLLGDTAVCFHPEDPRYSHLKGKQLIVPLINREVPAIFDDYVDLEFGTGALKVTPAHDANDFQLGKKHELETVDIFNDDATVSEAGQLYIGMDRFACREQITEDLKAADLLVGIEEIDNKLGLSERTHAVVEPKLTLQWYMSMPETAKPALDAVMNDVIKFFPPKYKNVYRHWMENIRDWCISRQLWWGQRIPAFYLEEGSDAKPYVAETAEEALALAIADTGNKNLTVDQLRQDEDVVDTWFSSWLWPISVFDGFETKEEVDYYYPTSVLVTGWDIIFLWVARMVMAGYEWRGEMPFKDVYFTGMVRDKQGRKMSKSLGNSPDALKLLADFGADAVRIGLLFSSPAGGDLLFDESLCDQGRNFSNKIWNALRLIKGWEVKPGENADNAPVIAWFENKIHQTINELEDQYANYRLSEIVTTLYSFIWNDFFSTYLEMIKPPYQQPIDQATYDQTIQFFDVIVRLLHPFMPFITEEVYQVLEERNGQSICVAKYPTFDGEIDTTAIANGERAKEILTNVRNIRNKNGLKQRELLKLHIMTSDRSAYAAFLPILKAKGFLEDIQFVDQEVAQTTSFLVGKDTLFLETGVQIDLDAERTRLHKEWFEFNSHVVRSKAKLSNDRFVNHAPEKVVAIERKKMADAEAKFKIVSDSLSNLGIAVPSEEELVLWAFTVGKGKGKKATDKITAETGLSADQVDSCLSALKDSGKVSSESDDEGKISWSLN